MTLTATYTDTTAKVTLAVTGAPANAATALIERSPDQVTWTAVRGGQAVPLASGAAGLDDYEYVAGQANYYRASYVSPAALAYNTSSFIGQTASNVPASTTISLSGLGTLAVGDAVFVVASLSAAPSAGQITCTTTGWTLTRIGTLGAILMASKGTSALANPVIGVTVASTTSMAWHAFSYTNAVLPPATSQSQVNAASATIPYPGITQPAAGTVGFLVGARAAAFTAPPGPITPTLSNATAGLLAYHGASSTILAGTVTFGSGTSSATSFVVEAWLSPNAYVAQDTASVTPAQTGVWLKNPIRPYLNRQIIVTGVDDITRTGRSGTFDVIRAALPVAVTDLMSGRASTVTVRCPDTGTVSDLEDCLAVGEVVLLQPPAGQRVTPAGYFLPGTLSRSRPAATGAARLLAIPVTEARPPDPGLAPTLSTWQTVISTYATWADLMAAKATWGDVLQLVGSPTDVITS